MQTVANETNSVHITRSLSRLKSIFITHYKDMSSQPLYRLLHKEFNTFYHPMNQMNAEFGYDPNFELEWQVQIGSRLYPEYSVRSTSESYYQLLKCLGILNSSFHSIDITEKSYQQLKFIIGLDLEKYWVRDLRGSIQRRAIYWPSTQNQWAHQATLNKCM